MNRSSDTSFLLKPVNTTSKKKQILVFSILLKVFITLIVFIKFEYGLRDASIDDANPVVKNDFEWLRNRNFLPLFVKPERDSSIVVPNNMKSLQVRDFVACFVISPPENSRMRDAVRQTWGKSMKAIFLVGRTDNETTNNFLTREAHEFNDVIIEDFIDSYDNLTIKTAFAFKNFLKHFNTSKHFFKIDDDAFLNVEGLYELLGNAPENSLVGRLEPQAKPIRDKSQALYIPDFIFDSDVFPPHLMGHSYVIPGLRMLIDYSWRKKTLTRFSRSPG
jgi:hypothetical protein